MGPAYFGGHNSAIGDDEEEEDYDDYMEDIAWEQADDDENESGNEPVEKSSDRVAANHEADSNSPARSEYNDFTSSDRIYNEIWGEVYDIVDGKLRNARNCFNFSSQRFFLFDPWNAEQKDMLAYAHLQEEPVQSYLVGAMLMHWSQEGVI
jgi:hypothetical protein